jgi:hypothetical protein
MRLDHVIYGVRDLDEAAVRLEQEYGLRFLRGGRHPGGTVNSVAPLEPLRYLELLAVENVVDEETREIASLIERGRTLLGRGVAVDDIDAVASRLGREVEAGSIAAADGSVSSWRFVDVPGDESLPFFIQYDDDPAARLRRWQERLGESAALGGADDAGSGRLTCRRPATYRAPHAQPATPRTSTRPSPGQCGRCTSGRPS